MKSWTNVTEYALAYAEASKKAKGEILDEVVQITGWSRDNARRRLTAAAKDVGSGSPRAVRTRKPRAPKYSTAARRVLTRVWQASGRQCGKYLAVSMRLQLDLLERHGELVPGRDGYDDRVRTELLEMSPATIDRYLAGEKSRAPRHRPSVAEPSSEPRTAVDTRRAAYDAQAQVGSFNLEIVAHRGEPGGEYLRTLNLTCMRTGWTFSRSVRSGMPGRVLAALQHAVERVPFRVVRLNLDHDDDSLFHALTAWAASVGIVVSRERAGRRSKFGMGRRSDLAWSPRHLFSHRLDTEAERLALNRLWVLTNDQLNFLTPLRRPVGWAAGSGDRRKRVYGRPATPLERLLSTDELSPAQQRHLLNRRDSLNPAAMNRAIADAYTELAALAATKSGSRWPEQPSAMAMSGLLAAVRHSSRTPALRPIGKPDPNNYTALAHTAPLRQHLG